MSRTYDIYGVGHALVDIQYSVPVPLLAELGIDKGVMTLIDEERQQVILGALTQDPIASASGGSAANTMIGAAGFGGRAYYACQLGEDEWGDFYRKDLESAGVHSNPANRVPGRTGQCVVFITPDADRPLNTFLGVSSSIGPNQLEETQIAASQYLYLEGYLLSSDSGFAACRRAQDIARQQRTAVSLTLSDPFMIATHRERFTELVATGVDLLFCNEDEARAYTGLEDREAACTALASQVGIACITCGAEGAILYEGGQRIHIPGIPVKAVDTTGAGDLFAGGLLFGITNGYSLEAAGKLGSYAAAQVVAQYGPRLNRPLADEIDSILARFAH
ncbi:MAG: adenosine kinase [Gemmatimonadetes bacterium]|nr:adenosine kinase [Gemmatimonadota bacterium]